MAGAGREQCANSIAARLLRLAVLGAAYLLMAELGHALAFHDESGEFLSYMPASGLYVCAMWLASGAAARVQLAGVICCFKLYSDVVLHGVSLPVSLGFCAAGTVEACVGAWAAHRAQILKGTSLTFRDVIGLAIVALACSSPASALVGAATLTIGLGRPFVDAFREWWISAGIGVVVFLPLWWTVLRPGPLDLRRSGWGRFAEGCLALGVLALVSQAIFYVGVRPVAYVTVPVTIWLAVRGGPTGVVLGNVVMSIIAVWHTTQGHGPLGQIFPMTFRAFFVQVFNVVASLSGLVLAAIVSERQIALAERTESDDRFRDLFDNISDLVAVSTTAGRLLFVNRAWLEVVGSSGSEEAQEANLVDVCHEDDREMLQHVLEVLPDSGVLSGIELRLLTQTGEILDVEGSFSCRSQAGTTDRVRVIFRDVTARKVSAQRLEQAHQQLEGVNRQLQLLAATDGLTSLANRRAFYDRLHQECHAAQRHDRPLSVILLDVDHFKSYNDSFGHPAGDDALRTIGWLLMDCVRDIDVPGRIGGEEFAIILPETDEAAALFVAERLRQSIGAHAWSLRRITASLGVATMTGIDAEPDRIVEAADQALYQAKRGGRDQTVRSTFKRWTETAAST